jgi:hypothetical protein
MGHSSRGMLILSELLSRGRISSWYSHALFFILLVILPREIITNTAKGSGWHVYAAYPP